MFKLYADMMELADMQDLESCVSTCRFDPCYPHHFWNGELPTVTGTTSIIGIDIGEDK